MRRRLGLPLGLGIAVSLLAAHSFVVTAAPPALAGAGGVAAPHHLPSRGRLQIAAEATSTASPVPPSATPAVEPPGATLVASETATPSPTPAPLPPVLINEYLPRPASDWNGDGTAGAGDEYVELYNAGDSTVDLGGWQLDDIAAGGSPAHTLAPGTIVNARSHLLLFGAESGVRLDDVGDTVRLLAPDGRTADSHEFRIAFPDLAWQRDGDGSPAWRSDWPPSPGGPNLPPLPPTDTPLPSATATAAPNATQTPTLTATATPVPATTVAATATRTHSATASVTPSVTASPPASPVHSPTTTRTVAPDSGARLSEVLPAPRNVDWDGDGTPSPADEWIELQNPGTETVRLDGWIVDDVASGGSEPYTLPSGTRLGPGEFLLLFHRETGIALNNDGDTVRLLRPDGSPSDTLDYTMPRPDASYSRDEEGAWHHDWPPSPGRPNPPPTPTPAPTSTWTPTPSPTVAADAAVRLSELLPAPKRVDWDGDGTPSAEDEWIELYNTGTETIELGGWAVDDLAGAGSPPYTIPPGTRLAPAQYLVLFRRETKLAFNNDGDELRLLRPDGTLHDRMVFDRSRPDGAFARDTRGLWHEDWPPSPGRPNRPPPTPTPYPASLRLNELLPAPRSDWNEDGRQDLDDEYVELLNLAPVTVDLGGYRLDDGEGGAAPFTIPPDTTLAPGAVRVFFRGETGLTLNDDGDTVRLFGPDGARLDRFDYGEAGPDRAWSRAHDGTWTDAWPPSPGAPNAPPSPTPVPPPPLPLVISEVVYEGLQPQDGDEFVEIFNPAETGADLAGWAIGDETERGGSEGLYRFPPRTIAPGAVVVVARNAAAFQARFGRRPDYELEPGDSDLEDVPNLTRDTRWGRGRWALNDSGDEVVLLDPYDRRVDALAFRHGDFAGLGLTGHDISAPAPRSLNRVADWRSAHLNDVLVYQLPTPGRPVVPPDPSPPPPAPALGDGLFAFWGTLHAHSSYSDGSGPPAYAFAVARANGQHFMALSDHSNWFTQEEWQALGAAAGAADAPGRFVALRAFEWTHRENGHINIFNTTGFVSRDEPGGESLADLYAFLAARPAAIGQFNHPFPGHFDDLRLEPARRDQMALVEVANGRPEFAGRYPAAYWQALFRGWRAGAAANLDTESADWGAEGGLRTGILAPALDRASLLEAIRARRTFATEEPTLALALRAGSTWMGGEIDPGPVTLTVLAAYTGQDTGQREATLELWREGAAVAGTRLRLDGSARAWTLSIDARPGEALVARAVLPGGQEAWTSPLFVRGLWQPPALRLTEVLPAPRDVDFNGDGLRDSGDEYVELHNPLDRPVGLGGWQVDDGEGGSRAYTLPPGTVLPPGGYLVLFKSQSGVALDQAGDGARLIAPNGGVVDAVGWSRFPGYDRSLSRLRDGTWISGAEPSPGGPAREQRGDSGDDDDEGPGGPGGGSPPGATAAPLVAITEARAMPLGRFVAVRGQVSAPPGLFGDGTMYLQDGTGGLKVYLRDGQLPDLTVGDQVEVAGRLGSFRGERELRPSGPAAVRRLGPGEAPLPLALATGELEAGEGRFVRVRGQVVAWARTSWTLDDGSGPAKVVVRQATGLRRPWLERGEWRGVAGIVARDGDELFVLPRTAADLAPDLSAPPGLLPVTGGE